MSRLRVHFIMNHISPEANELELDRIRIEKLKEHFSENADYYFVNGIDNKEDMKAYMDLRYNLVVHQYKAFDENDTKTDTNVIDLYDFTSHILIKRKSDNKAVGCMRCVENNDEAVMPMYPELSNTFSQELIKRKNNSSKTNFVEGSRICIDKNLSREEKMKIIPLFIYMISIYYTNTKYALGLIVNDKIVKCFEQFGVYPVYFEKLKFHNLDSQLLIYDLYDVRKNFKYINI